MRKVPILLKAEVNNLKNFEAEADIFYQVIIKLYIKKKGEGAILSNLINFRAFRRTASRVLICKIGFIVYNRL